MAQQGASIDFRGLYGDLRVGEFLVFFVATPLCWGANGQLDWELRVERQRTAVSTTEEAAVFGLDGYYLLQRVFWP